MNHRTMRLIANCSLATILYLLTLLPVSAQGTRQVVTCETEKQMAEPVPPCSPFTGKYDPETDCTRYVRLSMHFFVDENGQGFYDLEGNQVSNPTDPDYSAYDYAKDAQEEINRVLAENAPLNTGNGWFYYEDNESGYAPPPDYLSPAPACQAGLQFIVDEIHVWENAEAMIAHTTNHTDQVIINTPGITSNDHIEVILFPNQGPNYWYQQGGGGMPS